MSCFMLCFPQALKVLRSAEFAPFVVFIAAPSAEDLQFAKTSGIDVSHKCGVKHLCQFHDDISNLAVIEEEPEVLP